ncbi:Phosphomannomutase/phosphoglucomutase [Gemmata obscuriglobus]|uniref:Phosphoglucosamine mutase n=1 Tax=Gemmata obscuriglobus TaxID=114 RepID=A0A2Z3H2G0_9BACT|nr:phosphoglucosamine mutase [Gemmata obscuriglobus]AWM37746.1 phosphoglucosamine mutase [Gemmata obscuriglobus]QEG29442.1 Phosphomannomutase/phosphoglucomutase [Gemmata obscuriglobus]VTS08558.1 phosphomannomutase : Phosphoglucomutase/phosphomannomutase family protein OS=Rhodopirellula europaea 6C GN=RE6C_01147 PE=3 SV=1: PGM_PMM_I: PGM_PMM_II: PGM_PMM_III: PGM_PMM_IV [Gemmata obscuriglobus UQM 2246]
MAVPSDLIVSVSGIRGIVGAGLTAEAATRFAAAYGSTVAGKRVIVSNDGRPSGEMLRHAVTAGLLSAGCKVEDLGIASTPTCGFAVRQLNAAGAIQITASHNPAPWNGLKMFGSDGAVLPAAAGAVIRGLYESGDFARAAWNGIGTVGVPPDVGADHVQAVLDTVSVAAVAGQRFRVFLDANGGAGGPLGVKMLTDFGCEVIAHGCEATGVFAHEPEPIPAHLVDVAPWVKQHECAIGFVLDPDSDRLALIDENGDCVSEEATLALAVKYRLRQQPGTVAINMSTSRMNQDVAAAAGCPCVRSAVGEANVVALMRETGAVLGGEGNGGVIDPRIGWVRDPFVGMAFILSLMAEERKPFSQLVAELPRYAMLKTKFTISRERLPDAIAALEARWPEATINRDDGLRLDGPDWWLHVRGSNTEPVVRVIAETPDPERTAQLCREAGSVVTG